MRATFVVLIPVLALVLAVSMTSTPVAQARGTADARRAAFFQDLEGQMRSLKRTIDDLHAKIEDPTQRDAVLAEFVKLETSLMDCKGVVPPKAADEKDAERQTFVAEYRRMMIDVVSLALQAESKYLQGKVKDAKKLLRDIEASKGKGHGKFKK